MEQEKKNTHTANSWNSPHTFYIRFVFSACCGDCSCCCIYLLPLAPLQWTGCSLGAEQEVGRGSECWWVFYVCSRQSLLFYLIPAVCLRTVLWWLLVARVPVHKYTYTIKWKRHAPLLLLRSLWLRAAKSSKDFDTSFSSKHTFLNLKNNHWIPRTRFITRL